MPAQTLVGPYPPEAPIAATPLTNSVSPTGRNSSGLDSMSCHVVIADMAKARDMDRTQLGGLVGFLIGTQVGREGLDKLRKQATGVWNSPTVQKAASDARGFAEDKFPKTTETVTKVASAVSDTRAR